MIDTVLLDFGGVVIKTPFELIDTEWRGPFDPSGDPLWLQSQRHEITERDYWTIRAREFHPEAPDPIFEFMRELYDQPEEVIVRPEMAALVDRLIERGKRVAVLTNDLRAFHPPEWLEAMSIVERFDPLIDLSFIGFLKPAPEAYEYALKVLDAKPEAVLFVDDQKQNAAGARDLGIETVRFDPVDVAASIVEIERRLAGRSTDSVASA